MLMDHETLDKDNDDSFSDFISICAAWTWFPDLANDNCFLFDSDQREPENCERWGRVKPGSPTTTSDS